MQSDTNAVSELAWLAKKDLNTLIDGLEKMGYQVIGPTLDQDAIIYGEIKTPEDLPRGWTDSQSAGRYRVQRSESDAYFEFNVGPQSWKQYLFPPKVTVQTARLESNGDWTFESQAASTPKIALLGVRACELAAIAIQDRIFLEGPYIDRDYERRREASLIIAVNCTVANETCFCDSMNTGPRCTQGYDLALSEIEDGFVIQAGSEKGQRVIHRLPTQTATATQQQNARKCCQRANEQMGKAMKTEDLPNILRGKLEHPHWDDVASRCLSCTNCTMVCPTCFCSTVSDVSDLSGRQVDRERQWDSCFNPAFSYTAGGTVRNDIRSRYRQWLTHKLSSWHDQFDSSGCVGCGRCITWCPVGIDLRDEVAALREESSERRSLPIVSQLPVACHVQNPRNAIDGPSQSREDKT